MRSFRPLLPVLTLLACGDGAVVYDEQAPSFATVRDEILVPRCGTVRCHGILSSTFVVTIHMDEAEFVAQPIKGNPDAPIVVVGDPEASLLLQRVLLTDDTRMPLPPLAPLDEAMVEQLRSWIASTGSTR